MNKYTALGLLAAAAEGKRIIVVSASNVAVKAALDEVAAVADVWETGAKAAHAAGHGYVALPDGGDITFIKPSGLRGCSADVVLVEDSWNVDGPALVDDLHATVRASGFGEIVRY